MIWGYDLAPSVRRRESENFCFFSLSEEAGDALHAFLVDLRQAPLAVAKWLLRLRGGCRLRFGLRGVGRQ